jgi:hypothetical protein
MAIASITGWLENPDRTYHQGRALYEQYGENKAILALIKSGSGSYHLGKLIEGLRLVNQQCNLVPKPIVIGNYSAPAPNVAPGKTNLDFTSAPDQILRIRDEKTQNYAQARALFANIRVMDSKQHRLKAGLELLDLMDKVNEAWSVIDAWKDTGKIAEQKQAETEKDVAALTIRELIAESRNLPTYITKDRKLLETDLPDAKRVEVAFRLQFRIARLKLINNRLDGIV